MKMLKVVVFALLALLLVTVKASPVQHTESFQIIQLEESCVRQGGLCVQAEDCDPDNIPNISTQLCPKQRHLGVICCYI